MKPASGLIGFVFVILAFSSCGGESVSRDGNGESDGTSGTSGATGDDDDGGSGGSGGTSAGTGGSSTPKGGTSSGRGGTSSVTGGTAGIGGSTMAGMGGTPAGAGGGAGASGAGGVTMCTNTIVANEANNYFVRTGLTFFPVTVRPNTELVFRWSGLTVDLLGHGLSPQSDIDAVHLMIWKVRPLDFAPMLADGLLRQRDLAAVLTVYTEKMLTEARLFDFTSVGMPLPPEDILLFFDTDAYPPEQHTYTLMIASGTEIGKGTRMIQTFSLDPQSTNTVVEMTRQSTRVELGVNLRMQEPTLVLPGTTDVTIDWSGMEVTARQEVFDPNEITELVVAHYNGTPVQLEDRFLDLELIAEEMWRADIAAGTSASFTSLRSNSGVPFTGIDNYGTWIVALRCGPCLNPAPPYLSVMTPCREP